MTSKMCLVLLWLSVSGVAGATVKGSEQLQVPYTNGPSASRLCSSKPVYTEAQCNFIGCCTFQEGSCVGDEKEECPTFQIFQTLASGVDICARGWGKDECEWMGCCTFSAGECKSAVGLSACLSNIPRNLLSGVPDYCEGNTSTPLNATTPHTPTPPLNATMPHTTPFTTTSTTPGRSTTGVSAWEQIFGRPSTTQAALPTANETNLSAQSTTPLPAVLPTKPSVEEVFAPIVNTTDVPLISPLVSSMTPYPHKISPLVSSTTPYPHKVSPCPTRTSTTTPEVPLYRRPEAPPVAPCPPGAGGLPPQKPKVDAKPAEKPAEKVKPGEVRFAPCKPGNKNLPFSGRGTK